MFKQVSFASNLVSDLANGGGLIPSCMHKLLMLGTPLQVPYRSHAIVQARCLAQSEEKDRAGSCNDAGDPGIRKRMDTDSLIEARLRIEVLVKFSPVVIVVLHTSPSWHILDYSIYNRSKFVCSSGSP